MAFVCRTHSAVVSPPVLRAVGDCCRKPLARPAGPRLFIPGRSPTGRMPLTARLCCRASPIFSGDMGSIITSVQPGPPHVIQCACASCWLLSRSCMNRMNENRPGGTVPSQSAQVVSSVRLTVAWVCMCSAAALCFPACADCPTVPYGCRHGHQCIWGPSRTPGSGGDD